jgi:hypothetical protein
MQELIFKFESEILRMKWRTALVDLETAVRRHRLAQQKANFNPAQPRVPAGNPDGGQWTSGGGIGSDRSQDTRITLASLRPPLVPKRKPPTNQERNRIARELARSGQEAVDGAIAGGATWLTEKIAPILSSFDSPRSLEELQRAVSDPRPGYDIHHIVEKSSATEDGYPSRMIDAPENLVRIPTWKHWAINSWYQTKNKAYGEMSPRDYLRGKSWDERLRVGHSALIKFGVLKP